MSKQKTIYKTIVQIEILSEEPFDETEESIASIAHKIDEGDWSGVYNQIGESIPLTGKEAVDEITGQGSEPGFFQMDDEGNELEEDI